MAAVAEFNDAMEVLAGLSPAGVWLSQGPAGSADPHPPPAAPAAVSAEQPPPPSAEAGACPSTCRCARAYRCGEHADVPKHQSVQGDVNCNSSNIMRLWV